jgi:hypothetical protein
MKIERDAERRAALTAALGFTLLEPRTGELELLHGWLDTWRGIGDIVVGMARQDDDLPLTRYDGRGWRATFYTKRHGALRDQRYRLRLGADAVAGGTARGGGGAQVTEEPVHPSSVEPPTMAHLMRFLSHFPMRLDSAGAATVPAWTA